MREGFTSFRITAVVRAIVWQLSGTNSESLSAENSLINLVRGRLLH